MTNPTNPSAARSAELPPGALMPVRNTPSWSSALRPTFAARSVSPCLGGFLLLAALLLAPRAHAQPATFGNALSFNAASSQYVSVTNFGAIAPTNEVTVEFWAYTPTAAGQSAFILDPDQNANRFNAHINYGAPPAAGITYWDFGNINGAGTGRLGPIAAPTNSISNWVHYAFVASSNANAMLIYTNGNLLASKSGMTPFVRGTNELRIGGTTGDFYNGRLDEFRVWNTARSSSEISANFRRTLAGSEPGLLLYYRFDAAGGTVATNTATATGAAYNGTLVNGPAWTNSGAPFLYFTDGTTNIINAVAVTNAGDTYVGGNGPNNLLVITNGGTLVNGNGFLGYNSGASNNTVLVSGAGSLWTNSGALYVGNAGSGNRLVVSNGGTVIVSSYSVIGDANGASNNQAIVTGPGSLWQMGGFLSVGANNSGLSNSLLIANGGRVVNGGIGYIGYASANSLVTVTGSGSLWSNASDLYVGYSGSGNQLVVSSGGVVANGYGYLGFSSTANSNVAVVTGTGSRWNNSGVLTVGYSGSGNQLVVSNGGVVADNIEALIGANLGASNNSVVVTGTGSLWTNSGPLEVGYSGSGNQLVVSNGGTVSVPNVFVGYDTINSANNRVTVDGGTLFATNGSGTAVLDIRKGTNVFNAGLIMADTLLLTNSAGFFTFNGGTLITRGGTISNGQTFVVGASGTTPAILDVRAGVPLLANSGFILGNNATPGGNQLLITNGGTLTVTGDNTFVGNTTTSSSNLILISGVGSLWSNTGGNFYIGLASSGNLMVVSNGGEVANGVGQIGSANTASNNQVIVTGTGSLWQMNNFLSVGANSAGPSNSLLIANGGHVVNGGIGYIGFTSTNSLVTVTGSGSLWSNGSDLYVGDSGSAAQLVVSNGGTVVAANVIEGVNAGSANNCLTVDGGNLAAASGVLDIRRGTNVFNAGVITADNLLVTNGAQSVFTFNGGTLNVRSATVSNGALFTVGDGTSAATYHMTGAATNNPAFAIAAAPNGATEVGNTVTITTTTPHGFSPGQSVTIAGVGVAGYNGTFTILSATPPTNFTYTAASGLAASGGGTAQAAGGALAAGGHSFANNLVIASNASLTGNGTIVGTVTNFGTITVGSSAGSIRINGDLRLKSSSMLSFELGGLIATNQYDQLTVTNFAALAGTLSLSILPGFLPAPVDSFTVLKFNTYSFAFANAADAPGARVSLSNNLASFAVTYTTGTGVTLTAVRYTDSDGDGQGDLQEIAAGTDPLSQASELKVTTLARDAVGQITVTFQSVAGKTYRIEYSTNLVTWPIATTNVPATGASTQWVDDGSLTGGLNAGTSKRFYRVGLQ